LVATGNEKTVGVARTHGWRFVLRNDWSLVNARCPANTNF
jgi:nitrogen fixation protein